MGYFPGSQPFRQAYPRKRTKQGGNNRRAMTANGLPNLLARGLPVPGRGAGNRVNPPSGNPPSGNRQFDFNKLPAFVVRAQEKKYSSPEARAHWVQDAKYMNGLRPFDTGNAGIGRIMDALGGGLGTGAGPIKQVELNHLINKYGTANVQRWLNSPGATSLNDQQAQALQRRGFTANPWQPLTAQQYIQNANARVAGLPIPNETPPPGAPQLGGGGFREAAIAGGWDPVAARQRTGFDTASDDMNAMARGMSLQDYQMMKYGASPFDLRQQAREAERFAALSPVQQRADQYAGRGVAGTGIESLGIGAVDRMMAPQGMVSGPGAQPASVDPRMTAQAAQAQAFVPNTQALQQVPAGAERQAARQAQRQDWRQSLPQNVPNASPTGIENGAGNASPTGLENGQGAGVGQNLGMPLDPVYEQTMNILRSNRDMGLLQAQTMYDQGKADYGLQFDQGNRAIDENMAARGLFGSGVERRNERLLNNDYQRGLLGLLQDFQNNQLGYNTSYNQGLAQAMMELAQRTAADPYAAVPNDTMTTDLSGETPYGTTTPPKKMQAAIAGGKGSDPWREFLQRYAAGSARQAARTDLRAFYRGAQ